MEQGTRTGDSPHCRRSRLAPRNGVAFATCDQHTRMDMGERPEWVRRALEHRLPVRIDGGSAA